MALHTVDEGSDTIYVNEDVINEIGLTGKKEPIKVNVENDQTICFMSGTFEIGLGSTDGRAEEVRFKLATINTHIHTYTYTFC